MCICYFWVQKTDFDVAEKCHICYIYVTSFLFGFIQPFVKAILCPDGYSAWYSFLEDVS